MTGPVADQPMKSSGLSLPAGALMNLITVADSAP